jgi:hypothetical protein
MMPKYVTTGAILKDNILYEIGSEIELREDEAAQLPVELSDAPDPAPEPEPVQPVEPLPQKPPKKQAPKPAPVAKKPASKKAASKKKKYNLTV